jgi:DNA-binding PadR family transcriptional regulator
MKGKLSSIRSCIGSRKKILKGLLDIAILNEMTHRNAISVPGIIEFFVKKYAIYISSGTAYPIFERLEKQGYIVKLPNRLTRLYSITTAGKNMLENVQQNMDELEYFFLELVKTQGDR